MPQKIKYNNIIYGFDIETTTVESITSMYLSSFISVDFGIRHKDNDDIINNMSTPQFCRTSDDVNAFLVNLNEYSKKRKITTIIFCHNLAYEFDFLIKNVRFIQENFNNNDCLFLKPRIPLFIRVGNIEFRCSFRLLNAPLKKLGDNLGFKKLEIDYKSKYYYFSELPDSEYQYNARDVQLMLLAVLKECSSWNYIITVSDIPLTATGFTRKNNLKINSNANRKDYAGFCAYQRFFTADYIKFLENTFSGGYTHANALYVNKVVKNVASFDIVSSYIDTILHRKFPRFFKKYSGDYHLQFFNHISQINNYDYMKAIKNYNQPFKFAFMAHITLKNVKAKFLKKNLILPISASKCDFLCGIQLDNGRIFKAKVLKINVTEIDFFIISQFYEFTVANCDEIYYTKHYDYLMPYVINSTREYLNEKSILKKLLSKRFISKKDLYCEKSDKFIYSEYQIDSILQMDSDVRRDLLEDNYRRAKNKLNAQYGINVQKLLNPQISYDKESDIFINEIEENVSAKVLYRDFTNGLYITAYSRLNLFCYALYIIENSNCDLIYSDTDSWKIRGDIAKVKRANDKYNQLIESIVHNSEDYNIGYFDYEGTYDCFATLGCKKYIVLRNDKIICTIAGVNKKATSRAFTELYNNLNNDFDLFCKVAFSPCTILSNTITGKLVTIYHNEEYIKTVTDESGVTGQIIGNNMVELADSDYILMDIDKGTVNEFVQYFSKLQNTIVDYIPTYVYRDADGEVKYKYINDWKETIKLYRGQDVDFLNINI